MADLKKLIGNALNKAKSNKPSDDGYATRKVKGMTPSKMGYGKVEKGEKIVKRAESKLEKSVVKPYESRVTKANNLKEKYGEYPTYGQQKKIEKAAPNDTEKYNYGRMRAAKEFGFSPSKQNLIPETRKNALGIVDAADKTSYRDALKSKVKKGETLIQKGTMKVANIRNKG
jgi:hypothetical protein